MSPCPRHRYARNLSCRHCRQAGHSFYNSEHKLFMNILRHTVYRVPATDQTSPSAGCWQHKHIWAGFRFQARLWFFISTCVQVLFTQKNLKMANVNFGKLCNEKLYWLHPKLKLHYYRQQVEIVLKPRPADAELSVSCAAVFAFCSARSGSNIWTLMDLFEYDQINGKHSMINAPRTFSGFMSMFLPSWKCKILEMKCWKWRCREDLLNMWKKVSNHLSILNSIAC